MAPTDRRETIVCVTAWYFSVPHLLYLNPWPVRAWPHSSGRQYTAGNRQPGGLASNAMVNGGNLQCAHCRREPNRREARAADWQAGCWPPVHSTSMSVDGPCQVRLGATGLTRAFQSEAQSWCSATAQHGGAAPPRSSPRLGCQGEEGRAQATRRVAGT